VYGRRQRTATLAIIENAPVEFVAKVNKKELYINPKEDCNLPTISEYIEEVKKLKKNIKDSRPSWDEYFIGMANYVGTRATCNRGKSGCVIVRDKTGYLHRLCRFSARAAALR